MDAADFSKGAEMKFLKLIIVVALAMAAVWGSAEAVADDKKMDGKKEVATLAGGCFWCLEAMFEELNGVKNVESGFSGGAAHSTYKEVCAGTTGHAEVISITYNADLITYRDILTIFFGTHDPTTLNRQGADVGTQYRSAIFYHDESQKQAADEAIALLEKEKVFDNPVVTEVVMFKEFVVADDRHQDYYVQNQTQGYCTAVITPKMIKFRKEFADKLK
ncbi:MAG: peptide-methionine (S)-S-oxide reductase [Candidatus Krumholzibacteriia bacterium]